jgi:hypothetical protein
MTADEEAGLALATNPVDGTPMDPDKLAVIRVGLQMYDVALAIRNLQSLSRKDALDYLTLPMKQITYQLARQLDKAMLPAIEKAKPSVIQTAHDPAADFIRDANREGGPSIVVKQFEDKR